MIGANVLAMISSMVDILQHLPTPVTGNIPAKSLREYYPKHYHNDT